MGSCDPAVDDLFSYAEVAEGVKGGNFPQVLYIYTAHTTCCPEENMHRCLFYNVPSHPSIHM